MLSMRATFAAAEREAAQTRTREAVRSRAQKGYVVGGNCYGYTNVGQPTERRREVNEAQAEVVRRIFQLTTDGLGLHRVCQTLNSEGVASPKGRGWTPIAVYHMLHRDIYRGKSVVGRTTWKYRKGRKIKTVVEDPAHLIVTARPELRIVSDALWASAHARVARTRQVFQGRAKGTPRLDSGLTSKHLLSGFLSCGVCNGGLFVAHRGRRGYRKLYYACTTYHKRGTFRCTNSHGVPYEAITQKVVSHFNPAVIREYISTKLLEKWQDTKPTLDETKTRLQQDLKRLDRELANLTEAVRVGGGSVKALVEALQTAQAHRDDVTARLEHIEGLEKASDGGAVELDSAALDALAAIQDEAREHPLANPSTDTRTLLRFLLPEPIAMTPVLESGKLKEWRYEGRAVYDRILTGRVFKELESTTALLPSSAR
jgi:hypothetical protein